VIDVVVRRGRPGDLDSVDRLQSASPEAAQWDVREYLEYDFAVAVCGGCIAGFAVARQVAEGESELLNLAVDPAFRQRGIGRRLVAELTASHPGMLWLEVRESNAGARKFYESLGLSESGRRSGYYSNSGEGAIVMKLHS
jgi:ribosomal-protein-alanine N-acetyltransferase